MTSLFSPPAIFELPLSKGGDLHCSFVYKPLVVDEDGVPILDGQGNKQYAVANYPVGATVNLIVDSDTTITAAAVIVGSVATVHEDKAVADLIANNKLWRVVITYSDALDVVMANGTVARYDGKVRS